MKGRVFGVAALLLGCAAFAGAAELTLSGASTGAFDGGSSSSLSGLTYFGSTFDATTESNFYALGGDPVAGANTDNLGAFSLDNTANNYGGHTFDLTVTFSAPTGIAGGGTAIFHADLLGHVSTNNAGGVNVAFTTLTNDQAFTFTNPAGSGSFTLHVNDVAIHPGQIASITGYGTGSFQPVPEPASLAVVGIGLVGLLARRRKKA